LRLLVQPSVVGQGQPLLLSASVQHLHGQSPLQLVAASWRSVGQRLLSISTPNPEHKKKHRNFLMKNIEIAAAIACCLLLAGCGGSEAEAKKAVLANLKDPDSAKFGKFTQVGENLACMTVNAKNSMGGYTGDKQAFLKKEDGKWEFYFTQDMSHDMCIKMWPDLGKK
jgi:hypothetical protein